MAAALASSETFFLELSSASPEGEVRAWFEGAEPGSSAVYASGLSLPRDEAGVRYVAGLVAAKLARTHQRRHPQDARRWQFLVVKGGEEQTQCAQVAAGGSADKSASSSGAVGRERHLDHETRGQLRSLLSTLRSCAERGRPCPSDRALARELGLGGGERGRKKAGYLMKLARERGEIASECRGRNAPRVVTILAAGRARGKSTAEAGA